MTGAPKGRRGRAPCAALARQPRGPRRRKVHFDRRHASAQQAPAADLQGAAHACEWFFMYTAAAPAVNSGHPRVGAGLSNAARAAAGGRGAIETAEILADSGLMDSIAKSRADMRAGRIVLWAPRNAKTTKSI